MKTLSLLRSTSSKGQADPSTPSSEQTHTNEHLEIQHKTSPALPKPYLITAACLTSCLPEPGTATKKNARVNAIFFDRYRRSRSDHSSDGKEGVNAIGTSDEPKSSWAPGFGRNCQCTQQEWKAHVQRQELAATNMKGFSSGSTTPEERYDGVRQ